MNKVINYLKFIAIFLIFELAATFILSLLNLWFLNSSISTLILFILNITMFFILSYNYAKGKEKNGYLQGLLLGILLIIVMIIIKFILFGSKITISSIIYYLILLLISIIGGMFGINKKKE